MRAWLYSNVYDTNPRTFPYPSPSTTPTLILILLTYKTYPRFLYPIFDSMNAPLMFKTKLEAIVMRTS